MTLQKTGMHADLILGGITTFFSISAIVVRYK